MSDFAKKAEDAIPAEVRMISGCHDAQTSADVTNVGAFQLPDPAGKSGGACTSALLQVLYKDHHDTSQDGSWVDVLRQMRSVLGTMGYDQIPQLTSSRMIDVNETMHIVPPGCTGTKRAVLIGINYVGQQGELSGCHNDVHNIKEFIMDVHGFVESNITVLMDDGNHSEPTKDNILKAYSSLVSNSVAGDVVFCHYSGHGGQLPDDDGDEDDGFDETLIPIDFQRAGQIRDDDLFKILVHPMAAGVTVTCLMDCCHSGTVLDLPYRFTADGDVMQENNKANLGGFGLDSSDMACCCLEILLAVLGG